MEKDMQNHDKNRGHCFVQRSQNSFEPDDFHATKAAIVTIIDKLETMARENKNHNDVEAYLKTYRDFMTETKNRIFKKSHVIENIERNLSLSQDDWDSYSAIVRTLLPGKIDGNTLVLNKREKSKLDINFPVAIILPKVVETEEECKFSVWRTSVNHVPVQDDVFNANTMNNALFQNDEFEIKTVIVPSCSIDPDTQSCSVEENMNYIQPYVIAALKNRNIPIVGCMQTVKRHCKNVSSYNINDLEDMFQKKQ